MSIPISFLVNFRVVGFLDATSIKTTCRPNDRQRQRQSVLNYRNPITIYILYRAPYEKGAVLCNTL